jgi:hypothetical protein
MDAPTRAVLLEKALKQAQEVTVLAPQGSRLKAAFR